MNRARLQEGATLAGILLASFLSRAWVAGQLELSDNEALLWAEAVAWPAATPPPLPAAMIQLSTFTLGNTELAVRLPGIFLSTLVIAVAAAQARDRTLTLTVLASIPLLAVGGLFATSELYLALAWTLGLCAAARDRWGLAALAGVAALLCVPRTGSPFPTGPDPLALVGGLLFWATPMLVLAALALWAGRGRGEPVDRLLWWSSWPLLLPAVSGWPTAGGPLWSAVAIGLGRGGPRLMRAAWLGAGVAGLASAVMLVHLVNPLVNLSGDPRIQLAGGRILASSVSAWDAPVVLTEERADAALLLFYGARQVFALADAGRMVDRVDQALVVRPWRGNAELTILREGFETEGPNDVAAWIDTPDPLVPRLAARWQVYSVFRTSERPSEL